MLPDRVSNPGPLTYKSGGLIIALRSPAPTSFIYAAKVFITKLSTKIQISHIVPLQQ